VLVGLRLERLDLGPTPPRLEGVKAYERTREDEVMLEAPVVWVSGLSVRLFHCLRLASRQRAPSGGARAKKGARRCRRRRVAD